MILPDFNSPEEFLEFLYDEARAHQIANDERPQFTVHPRRLEWLAFEMLMRHLPRKYVNDANLGEGLQGPNYQIFADVGLDENELDVVRVRDSGVR